MSKSVLAKVHWIPAEEGGRTFLPTGKKYATISRFTEDTDVWLQEAWSIVLELTNLLRCRGTLLSLGHGSWSRKRLLTD